MVTEKQLKAELWAEQVGLRRAKAERDELLNVICRACAIGAEEGREVLYHYLSTTREAGEENENPLLATVLALQVENEQLKSKLEGK